MNLDRFDGYPGGEEQRQIRPTALDMWMALGFDEGEEVEPVNMHEEKDFAPAGATKGLSARLWKHSGGVLNG